MGSIEVIVGGMYSGKTEELIRRLKRSLFARQKIQVFKPQIDDRYHKENVTSHNQNFIQAQPVKEAIDILRLLQTGTQVVGIDEGQFFDEGLVDVAQTLADRGLRVIVAGLDVDWKAEPFEPMPKLMAIAEQVIKQNAVCVVCGDKASRTQRVSLSEDRVMVGSHGMYEARCRQHFKAAVVAPFEAQEPLAESNNLTANS